MKIRGHQSHTSSKPSDPVQLVDAAPAVGKLPKVDELTALAASLRFLDNNPGVEEQVSTLVTTRTTEILRELEKDPETETFLVSERNVRAIFTKAMHETLGLVTMGMGNMAVEDTTLQHQFDASEAKLRGLLPGTATEPQGGV